MPLWSTGLFCSCSRTHFLAAHTFCRCWSHLRVVRGDPIRVSCPQRTARWITCVFHFQESRVLGSRRRRGGNLCSIFIGDASYSQKTHKNTITCYCRGILVWLKLLVDFLNRGGKEHIY